MNRALVDQVVNAVLYEGYVLYPYRPSVKNRQRWTFGGLVPREFSQVQGDSWSNQTECLVHGRQSAVLEVTVRFLHLTERVGGEVNPPLRPSTAGTPIPYRAVPSLRLGDRQFYTWQEAEERTVDTPAVTLQEILERPRRQAFAFSGRRWLEPLRENGGVAAVLAREQKALEGVVELYATEVAEELFRVTLRVLNETKLDGQTPVSRDAAMLRSLVSTHAVLGVQGGEFVSLTDPPVEWREEAAACRNIGTWPVLVGEEGEKDTLLASPIILYDYPQIAHESPGNLFDGTEIDEILTLRILTLTDEEKQTAAALDERVRELLMRTEALPREDVAGLHGTIRGLSPVSGGEA
jgi:hypothetical protein